MIKECIESKYDLHCIKLTKQLDLLVLASRTLFNVRLISGTVVP